MDRKMQMKHSRMQKNDQKAKQHNCIIIGDLINRDFNPFVPNAPLFYPLKTSGNRKDKKKNKRKEKRNLKIKNRR